MLSLFFRAWAFSRSSQDCSALARRKRRPKRPLRIRLPRSTARSMSPSSSSRKHRPGPAPYRDIGAKALSQYGDLVGTHGAAQQQSAIDALKASPFYQSLFRTGEETELQDAAATGGVRGGNTQRSLADFGSDTLMKTIMAAAPEPWRSRGPRPQRALQRPASSARMLLATLPASTSIRARRWRPRIWRSAASTARTGTTSAASWIKRFPPFYGGGGGLQFAPEEWRRLLMPGLDDYGALLRSGAASVPDYAADEARKQLAAVQIGQERRLEQAQQHELADEESFQGDLTSSRSRIRRLKARQCSS
jgi:hypothetical protein